jgi:nicotinamidase-related amidase
MDMELKKLLNPATTVLIVVDKQAGYFDPELVKKRFKELPPDATDVLEGIDSFIEQARRAGLSIVWTQMVEDATMSPKPIAEIMNNDPEQVTTITKPGDPSFEIYGRVKPDPSEKVITKYRYDAFSQTELAAYLKNLGIETCILVGGYASRCVLSTVVGANGEDFLCIVPKGLVINQSIASHEVNFLYDIVNAIFGCALDVNVITDNWKT